MPEPDPSEPDPSHLDPSRSEPDSPGLPRRPFLRPGVRVCRRSAGELQVGLDPTLAVVLPDTPAVRAALADLGRGAAPSGPGAARVLARLRERGLVVDGDAWLSALGAATGAAAAGSVTAAVADAGLDAHALLERRGQTSVLVDDLGLPGAADRVRELLDHAGVLRGGGPGGGDLVVLVCGQEPDRDLLDHWMREDVPHVLLTANEGALRLGPFVDPGRTACLRCLDAAASERDPRHGLVLRQYAHARPSALGLPAPLPSDLLDLAVGHLVRDVLRWADGQVPRTWSATVRLDNELDLVPLPVPRHPACGCAWSAVLTG